MILLLNLRRCTCIPPRGKPRLNTLYESHMRLGKCLRGDDVEASGVSVCVCVYLLMYECRWACALLFQFLQTNTSGQTGRPRLWKTVHKRALCIISQTPEPEGAWLWRFIIAYWIIWINLTHLGPCVFLRSQLSRLLVSDNCTKWVISFCAPLSFLSTPPLLPLAFSTS